MQAKRPDNFDDMLHNASGRNEFKPNQKVWKGIASHFDKIERKRRIIQGSVFVAFTLICTLSALYFNNKSDATIANTLHQLKGREIFTNNSADQVEEATNNTHTPALLSSIYNSKQPKPFQLINTNNIIAELYANNSPELLSPIKQYPTVQFVSATNNIEPIPQYKPIIKPYKKPHKSKWQLGYSIGYFINKARSSNPGAANTDITLLPLHTLQIGSTIEYKVSPKWTLSSGVNIYKAGVSYYFSSMNSHTPQERKNNLYKYTNSFWVAEIPLSINYNGSFKKNWGYTIGTGVAVQCKLPSYSNDGGYHTINYGRSINGIVLLNAKLTKETKNLNMAFGPTLKYQMLNTNRSGNYKLLQIGAELNIGIKL